MRRSVFTVEICARIDAAPGLLDELRAVARNAPEEMTRPEALERHAAAAGAILRSLDSVERGCWEYFDDQTTATAMFEDWCRPLFERPDPGRAPGPAGYRDTSATFLAFTFVYLLARDSPSDLAVRVASDVPEDDYWRVTTFRRLLEAVRWLKFESVKAAAIYLVPRDREWGLTLEDLAAETYEYLRVLER